jgi:hypothetical protein
MKYLLIFILSHLATYCAIGAVIDARLQGLAEDLRLHAQHSKIEYCALLGTLLAALLSLLTWGLS